MNTPILVISLDRTPERKTKLEEQFQKIGIEDYYFFPAFDGKNITNFTLNPAISAGYGMGRNFEKAELAIIMSHIAALKMAQMVNFEDVIILEDDIAICSDWYDRLHALKETLPNDWDHVYLSGHSDYVKFQVYDEPTLLPSPPMVGAFSYMVNYKAYKKIIDYCTSFTTTVDDMIMEMVKLKRIKSFIYLPFMTYHAALESTIWNETAQTHSSKFYFRDKI